MENCTEINILREKYYPSRYKFFESYLLNITFSNVYIIPNLPTVYDTFDTMGGLHFLLKMWKRCLAITAFSWIGAYKMQCICKPSIKLNFRPTYSLSLLITKRIPQFQKTSTSHMLGLLYELNYLARKYLEECKNMRFIELFRFC